MKVTDVNNVESYYKTTRIENLTTPDHVINFKNAPSLVIDEVTTIRFQLCKRKKLLIIIYQVLFLY